MTGPLNPVERAELTDTLKRRYLELWSDVRGELGRLEAESYQDTAGETHDSGDEAVADTVVDVHLADVHRDIGEMREITVALSRILNGSYGVCSDCGDEIGLPRLRANPTAARCEHCQHRYEQLHVPAVGPTL